MNPNFSKKGMTRLDIENSIFPISEKERRLSKKLLFPVISDLERELTEMRNKMDKVTLSRKKESQDNQEAIVYEGYDGIKSAFNDILNSLGRGEEYYVFTLGKELFVDQLKYFFASYHNNRIEKGINVKLIAKKEMKKDFAKSQTFKGMKFKYTEFHLPTGIFIYKNKVMTLVWGENPTAFVINSKNNYEKYKEFFEDMWKKAS